MRAVGLHRFGGPEVLEVLEVPVPEPAEGEVRVRVHAAAVNPTDTLLRSGATKARFAGRPGPYIPGMDAAGVVDAVGPGVGGDRFRPGDRVATVVMPYLPRGGAYAELVVVPAASVVPIPAGADFRAAATLLMNALTARMALDALAVAAGDTIAVTGAAGTLGGYAIQLAKVDGLRVLADAAPADEALVASLGADEIVPRGDGVADRLRALAPRGVAGVVDAALLHERILPAIRDGGGIAVVRGWSAAPPDGVQVHPIWVNEAATDTDRLTRLRDQAERGILTLRVAGVHPAGQAADAHRRLESGGLRGRLVLDFTS